MHHPLPVYAIRISICLLHNYISILFSLVTCTLFGLIIKWKRISLHTAEMKSLQMEERNPLIASHSVINPHVLELWNLSPAFQHGETASPPLAPRFSALKTECGPSSFVLLIDIPWVALICPMERESVPCFSQIYLQSTFPLVLNAADVAGTVSWLAQPCHAGWGHAEVSIQGPLTPPSPDLGC